MFKLSGRYLVHYKSQSFAILLSMILSIALMAGVSSLVYSGEKSNLENSKEVNGDWNYAVPLKNDTIEKITSDERKGYKVEEYGICQTVDEPVGEKNVALLFADESYLEMTKQKIVKGKYPETADDIAMSKFVLDNLGFEDEIGEQIILGNKQYRLSGIVKNEWAADSNSLKAFISKEEVSAQETTTSFVYLKLDESKKMYKQSHALKEDLKLSGEVVKENDNVNYYLGGESPKGIFEHLEFALTNPEGNFTYLMLVLRDEFELTVNGIIVGLGLFSIFIIYSIFNVNVSKRISQYGILKTIGIGRKQQFFVVLFELWMLLVMGFPIGVLLGNLGAKVLYQNISTVFLDPNIVNAGSHGLETQNFLRSAEMTVQKFHVSYSAIIFEAIFLTLSMCFIAWRIQHRTEKVITVQLLKGDYEKKRKSRIIYSRRFSSLSNILNGKFMLERKRTFVSILITLSLGGVIFLCSTLVLNNAKVSNQMQLASDDGLSSDFKLYENNCNLNEIIDEKVVNQLEQLNGLENVYAVKSYIGELLIEKDSFFWQEYFEFLNEEYEETYNGYMNETKDNRYAIKSNVLGYNDPLLEKLQPYILDGSIDPNRMRRNNEIVLVTLEDAQGNHDSIAKSVGDTITLRVPKQLSGSLEDLKQLGNSDDFMEKEFTISAIVSRTMVRDSQLYTLKEQPDITYSIIMTNEQMEQNFGVKGYRVLSMEKEKKSDTQRVVDGIKNLTLDLEECLLQDYTGAIERQNEYLFQKTLFYYGIALAFLLISLFHIMNTMSHLIISRKHEFGILRAMGITDKNFRGMMFRQGILYGIFSSIVMLLLYLIGNRIVTYFMGHVYGFLVSNIQVNIWIILATVVVNILIGIVAVLIPTYVILKENIIQQINLS